MYRPYSRFGLLVKALAGASIAASWPGMLALTMAFYAPRLLLVPLTTFAIAFGHALVLGLPLYLLLDRRGWANGWLAALAGACIGMVPVLIFTTIDHFQYPSDRYAAGWLTQVSGALWLFGFLGLCGGLTFFAIVSGDRAAEE
ncbi:hypothetical protein [Sphingomonas sp. UNC305MFCol5.2]|uniref:hypothetical protein n=1 Tax=Sphingomonas sp. UNC305MFCol5.2 TaxID=1449076 RepID=UPI0004113960|nr:hypothetical protein [Sphingomonas sp. UNC305MFCol5.2]